MKLMTISMFAAFLISGIVHADEMVSEADKAACKPDVNRICSDYIPDRDRIIICLKKNISKLGKPCHAVMTRAGN